MGADSWTISEATSNPSPGPELNKLGLNQPGTDSGSYSVTLHWNPIRLANRMLSNGSLVTFNTTGAPIITIDDVSQKLAPARFPQVEH